MPQQRAQAGRERFEAPVFGHPPRLVQDVRGHGEHRPVGAAHPEHRVNLAVPAGLHPAGGRGEGELVGGRPLAQPFGQVVVEAMTHTGNNAAEVEFHPSRRRGDQSPGAAKTQLAAGVWPLGHRGHHRPLGAATGPGACRAADAGCPSGPAAAGNFYQPSMRSKQPFTAARLGRALCYGRPGRCPIPSGRYTSSVGWDGRPQRIYRFEHGSVGSFDIFIVPIGPDAGTMQYEAVFS